jgi:hypothetical protein
VNQQTECDKQPVSFGSGFGSFEQAVAKLLEVEAHIRDTQPSGFYEVAEADLVTNAVLNDFPVKN